MHKVVEEVVSLVGKNEEIILELKIIISTSKALGVLALKNSSSCMKQHDLSSSPVFNFVL
jgi:hypothetical protein